MYLVTRGFGTVGVQLTVGEVVSGNGYKLLEKLLSLRYLIRLGDEIKPIECQACKRKFIDTPTIEIHYLAEHPEQVEVT